MIRFIIRRLLAAVLLLFVISAVTYMIFFLVPRLGGATNDDLAARFIGKSPTPEAIAAVKKNLGFDKPLVVQYWDFVQGIFVGRDYTLGAGTTHCNAPCLGYSFRNSQPVLDVITRTAPVTISLAIGAAVLWLIVGIGVGVVSALKRGTIIDRTAMTIALAGVSLPIFFTGLLAQSYFVHQWHIFPDVKWVPFTQNPAEWARALILPWVVLAFLQSAMYARMSRAGMLETMNEDYIRTARAKGLPERTVSLKHGLRATLTPLLTIFGLDLGILLSGAVVTEKTFSLPGMGSTAVDAISQSDLPIVVGVVLVGSFFIVMANLVVDILYAVVDPRVRLS